MSLEAPPINRPRKGKRSRSWFQFSLRTFLILTILVGGILSQAASEFATARNRERAVARLEAGGYHVYLANSMQPRWITSLVSDTQWRRWFPNGISNELDGISPVGGRRTPSVVLSNQEVFSLLNTFDSCKRVGLRNRGSGQETISATDLLSFHGWKDIEDVDLSGALPDESAFRLLATSANLKELTIENLVDVPLASIVDFLSRSSIESLELDHVSFVGEASWRCSDSLKRIRLSNTNLSSDKVRELLADSRIETLELSSNLSGDAHDKWNSQSLRDLTVFDEAFRDFDLLGELPALKSLTLSGFDEERHGEGLGRLCRYSNLAELTYYGSPDSAVIQGIGRIESLRSLRLFGRNCSLASIASLKNLESFEAEMTLTQNDVNVLRRLPKLKEVSLKGNRSSNVMLPLLDAPSLRKLTLHVKISLGSSWDALRRRAQDLGISIDEHLFRHCPGVQH